MKRRAILAFMLDRPGVLNKVSMLIRKKMYNARKVFPSAGEHRDIEGRIAPGDPGAAGEGGRSSEEDTPPLA